MGGGQGTFRFLCGGKLKLGKAVGQGKVRTSCAKPSGTRFVAFGTVFFSVVRRSWFAGGKRTTSFFFFRCARGGRCGRDGRGPGQPSAPGRSRGGMPPRVRRTRCVCGAGPPRGVASPFSGNPGPGLGAGDVSGALGKPTPALQPSGSAGLASAGFRGSEASLRPPGPRWRGLSGFLGRWPGDPA